MVAVVVAVVELVLKMIDHSESDTEAGSCLLALKHRMSQNEVP